MAGFFRPFTWGKKLYTPDTLPAEYRSLLLLSLLDFDYFIGSRSASALFEGSILQKGRERLYDFCMDFIIPADGKGLDLGEFQAYVTHADLYDPFEIFLVLAERFFNETGKEYSSVLSTLLSQLESGWGRILKGALFCAGMEDGKSDQKAAIMASFVKRHLIMASGGEYPPVPARFDLDTNLYLYYYCCAKNSGLLKAAPEKFEAGGFYRFIYETISRVTSKIEAAMLAIRFYSMLEPPESQIVMEDLSKIYKLALFDRARKAFTYLAPDKKKTVFVKPDNREIQIIFNSNLL